MLSYSKMHSLTHVASFKRDKKFSLVTLYFMYVIIEFFMLCYDMTPNIAV